MQHICLDCITCEEKSPEKLSGAGDFCKWKIFAEWYFIRVQIERCIKLWHGFRSLSPIDFGNKTFKCHSSRWKYGLASDVELEILQNLAFVIVSSELMELQWGKRAASEIQVSWLAASNKAGCKEFMCASLDYYFPFKILHAWLAPLLEINLIGMWAEVQGLYFIPRWLCWGTQL